MKKALIAIDLISLYMQQDSLLGREDVKVLTAASNDAFLKTHRQEKVDLMVTRLDMPGGIKTEKFFELIRQSEELRQVSIILIGEDTPEHRERIAQCRANAVFIKPFDIDLLHVKMRQLLSIAPRQPYQEMLQIVDIEGKFGDRAFFGRGENISSSGILIKTEDVFATGDRIYFSFFLPDGMRIQVRGEVVRLMKLSPALHACRYGARFTDITQQNKAAIELYVNKH